MRSRSEGKRKDAPAGVRYHAFISYRQEPDAEVARRLQRALEKYSKKWPFSSPAVRLYRDRENLSAGGAGLHPQIESGLSASQYLIVVASPDAAQSQGVRDELEWWREQGRMERVVIALAGGKLEWDRARGDFDPDVSDALPPALCGALPTEPLFADIRKADARVGRPEDRAAVLREAAHDIIPTLLDVPKEELNRRNERKRRLWLAGVCGIGLVLLAFLAVTIASLMAANRQTQLALESARVATARQLILRAETQEDSARALETALAAHALAGSPETRSALLNVSLRNRFVGRAEGRPTDPIPLAAVVTGGRLLREGPGHTLAVWNLADPRRPVPGPTATTSPHTGSILALAVTPDGRTAASGGADGSIVLWDLATGGAPRDLAVLRRPDLDRAAVARLSVIPDDPRIGWILSLGFSADGRRLVAGGFDRTVNLYEVADRRAPAPPTRIELPGLGLEVLSVALSPNGRTLAVGSRTVLPGNSLADTSIQLFDITDVRRPGPPVPVVPLTAKIVEPVPLAFSPDGRTLISASDGTPSVWRVDGPVPQKLEGDRSVRHTTAVNALGVSPDGVTVATGGFDDRVIVWSVADRVTPISEPLVGQGDDVTALAFTADAADVVALGRDKETNLWEAGTGPRVAAVSGVPVGQYGAQSLATSPDRRTVATGGRDRVEALWDVAGTTPRPLGRVFAGRDDGPFPDIVQRGTVGAFSPDGRSLATSTRDGTLRLWDVAADGRVRPRGAPLPGPSAMNALAFSPDGRTLLVGDDTGRLTTLTDLGNPFQARVVTSEQAAAAPLTDLTFVGDGRTFVTAVGSGSADGGSVVQIWALGPDGVARRSGPNIEGHTAGVTATAVNGTVLITASLDGTARRWDLADPARPRPVGIDLGGHDEGVTGVAISPDGRTAATSGVDSTVRLWDLSDPTWTWALGPEVRAAQSQVTDLEFGPEGRTLRTTSLDDGLRVLDLGPLERLRSDPVSHACALTGGGFDRDAWRSTVLGQSFVPSCP